LREFLKYLIFFLLFAIPTAIRAVDIANSPVAKSPHNLASWATATDDRAIVKIKAVSETEICKFCHVPHGAIATPLWGHRLSTATYRAFSSATLLSPRNQPDGGSKQCLSCHDGTIAVGDTIYGNILVTAIGGNYLTPDGKLTSHSGVLFGTDINNPVNPNHPKHPISIAVTNSLVAAKNAQGVWKLRNLESNACGSGKTGFIGSINGSPVNCDGSEQLYPLRPTIYSYNGSKNPDGTGMQCTTCHEPHNNQYGNFMREQISFSNWSCAHSPSIGGDFCYHCHTQ